MVRFTGTSQLCSREWVPRWVGPTKAGPRSIRNQHRVGRRKVPDAAIRGTASKLEPPSLEEGFDALFVVRPGQGEGFEVTRWAGFDAG